MGGACSNLGGLLRQAHSAPPESLDAGAANPKSFSLAGGGGRSSALPAKEGVANDQWGGGG